MMCRETAALPSLPSVCRSCHLVRTRHKRLQLRTCREWCSVSASRRGRWWSASKLCQDPTRCGVWAGATPCNQQHRPSRQQTDKRPVWCMPNYSLCSPHQHSLATAACAERRMHLPKQVTAMVLGRPAKQRDKIFVAAGDTVSALA